MTRTNCPTSPATDADERIPASNAQAHVGDDVARPAQPAGHHDGTEEPDPQSDQAADDHPGRRDGPRGQGREIREMPVGGGR